LQIRKEWDKFTQAENPVPYYGRIALIIFLVGILIPAIHRMSQTPSVGLLIQTAILSAGLVYTLNMNHFAAVRSMKKGEHITGTKEANLFLTCRFRQDGFEINEYNVTMNFSYDQVRCVHENRKYFYLWFVKKYIVVNKDTFTIGNSDDFDLFIRKRCSEKQPLLTLHQLSLYSLKKSRIPIIIFSLLCFCLLWASWWLMLTQNQEPLERVLAAYQTHHNVQIIASEELPGGAVVFGVEEVDTIFASLYRKTGSRYIKVHSHSYSITGLVNWTNNNNKLFESSDDLLTFLGGEWNIVFGVADLRWWNNHLPDVVKSKYSTVEFWSGTRNFVLYYRDILQSRGDESLANSRLSSPYRNTKNSWLKQQVTADKLFELRKVTGLLAL